MQKFAGIIVGIIMLVAGIFLYIRNNNLVKNCTVETKAIVVNIEESLTTDEDGTRYMYTPVLEYIVDGNNIRSKMDSSYSTSPFSINDEVTILYNPNKVKEFIVKGEKTAGIMSIVFMAIGVCVTCGGVIMLIKKN